MFRTNTETFMAIAEVLRAFLTPGILGLACYVFRSVAVYTIAKRRELKSPWMAWVPVTNDYLLGSVSDQYQYVAKRKNTNRRKWLLVLEILRLVITAVVCVACAVLIGQLVTGILVGESMEKIMRSVLPSVAGAALILCLLLGGLSVAVTVIRYVALYDVFTSLDPKNSVMYLVFSIFFGITEPIFLFANREKDRGMPPRRVRRSVPPRQPEPQPAWQPTPEAAPEDSVQVPTAEEPEDTVPITPVEEPVAESEPQPEPEMQPEPEPEIPQTPDADPWDAE